MSWLVNVSAGLLALAMATQGRRIGSRLSWRRQRAEESRMPRVSEDLLAGFQTTEPIDLTEQPARIWRWNRDIKQFSITLYFSHPLPPLISRQPAPAAVGTEGLLLWKLFTYIHDGRRIFRQESEHRQTIAEFLTFGPFWHAPTPILLEILSYLGTDVPLWFEKIYLREIEEGNEDKPHGRVEAADERN